MLPSPIFGSVTWYSFMAALGLLVGIGVFLGYAKAVRLDKYVRKAALANGLISVWTGLIGGILFQSLYSFIDDPTSGFRLRGITFLSGLLCGYGVFLLLSLYDMKKAKKNLGESTPLLACAVCVAHAFGRIGCFFAGCCYGKATSSFLGVKFPALPERVHPTQLYEAVFLFLLFGVLSFLALRFKYKYNAILYLFAYSIFRFLIEFLRGDERGSLIPWLSPSQFLSIAVILGIIIWLIIKTNKHKTEDHYEDHTDHTV